ncbi:5448_t:CDS:2, partial [Diversispora eburnea]
MAENNNTIHLSGIVINFLEIWKTSTEDNNKVESTLQEIRKKIKFPPYYQYDKLDKSHSSVIFYLKLQKKGELLQTYNRAKNELGFSKISRTYGYENINHEDTLHVEKKLAKLEEHSSKRNQFIDKRFDPMTQSMVENFIKEHNLQNSQVWLQNIREILETLHEGVKDNPRIFELD